MIKQILIVAGLIAGCAGVFGGSVLLFRNLKPQIDADQSPATAGMTPDATTGSASSSPSPEPQGQRTEAEKINEIAKSMWRLPSPMGFDELTRLTDELQQERKDLQEERAALTSERKELARARADLEEREKIVAANIKELEGYLEEATRAQDSQQRRAGLVREGEEAFVKRLAKDFEDRNLKPEEAAGILAEMDEALALRLLRRLSTSVRSKIYANMGQKEAARWIGRLQELDILESSASESEDATKGTAQN